MSAFRDLKSILTEAQYWASDDVFDLQTRKEIQELLERKDERELTDRFYRDLEFGTGGLRGILGAGSARMNIYNIRKAAAALTLELQQMFPNEVIRVALTHDSRKFSREFAQAAAEVIAGYGCEALITKELRPVPMLSFMVRSFSCKGGACITASHNPPNYNGFKVYGPSGSQVTPPLDQSIIDKYGALKDYGSIKRMAYAEGLKTGLIREIGTELDDQYYSRLKAMALFPNQKHPTKIVFTPLHGTAGKPVKHALSMFGFHDVTVVPEQAAPDGNFPTVKFPNPEDPAALTLALNLGKKLGADLVLGTDPDCDRIGIVVREGADYVYLNGNQIGVLLTEFYLRSRREQNLLPLNPLVIKTIVTTDLQARVAQRYGADVEETLTGFKWICERVEEYESGRRKPYKQYVCGGEESYGFLAERFVRDKDGIMACCLAAEMLAYYQQKNLSIMQVLDQIFERDGLFQELLHTETLPGKDGAEKIRGIMKGLRSSPPAQIAGSATVRLLDFENSQEFIVDAGKLNPSAKLTLPVSDVLQFELKDGSKVSVRPSGTEPKIKFYISVHTDAKDLAAVGGLAQAKSKALRSAERILADFLKLCAK